MKHQAYLFLVYGLFFLTSALFSFLINGLFLKFSSSLGIRNQSDTVIRWSPQSKPSFGGISFYVIFLLSIASYPIFFAQNEFLFNQSLLGILCACTFAFLLGLSDDAYDTKPLLKFIVQILCATVLISTGTYIQLFSNLYLDYAFTFFWVIGLMNSINMLDNMDGITTIVSITIIMSALLILYIDSASDNIYIFLLIGVMAALIGFLYFNWHPSKIFMGDTGSQFLGLFLAVIGILYFWNSPDIHGKLIHSKQLFSTLLTFAIPIIDTTTVVLNRLAKGSSPFVGGKDHTTHALFYMGITEKRIAILYFAICMLSMFFNYLIIKHIENWGLLHIILFSVYFLLLFWLLYAPTRKHT
jgi:UDP-GlcNAc:undecaprenyl-phosphate GlcNAc-1-phosphate transferase